MPWYLGLILFFFIYLIICNILAMYIYGTLSLTLFPSDAKVVMCFISIFTAGISTGITFGHDL